MSSRTELAVSISTLIHSSLNEFEVRTEERVERLVTDISRVIQAAEPAKRAGLKELAETLLHEEISTVSEKSQAVESQHSDFDSIHWPPESC